MIAIRILRLTRAVARGDRALRRAPARPAGTQTLPDGRLAVKVFPTDALDAALLAQARGRGCTCCRESPPRTCASTRPRFYRKPARRAGSASCSARATSTRSRPPTRSTSCSSRARPCVLKMNPVNAYLGPLLERAFRSARRARASSRSSTAARRWAARSSHHPAVDEVHITGSDKTHDAIVWGPPGPERGGAAARGTSRSSASSITCELGNISPVLVVPGPVHRRELAFQGRNVAGMVRQQRVVQLQRGEADRDRSGLGAPPPAARGVRAGPGEGRSAQGLLPRRRGALEAVHRGPPGREAHRHAPGRASCRGR